MGIFYNTCDYQTMDYAFLELCHKWETVVDIWCQYLLASLSNII